MKFDNLKYPCSTSAFLYGPDDELLVMDKDFELAGHFLYEKKFWGIVYSFVQLSNDEDVANKMNEDINLLNGVGMINVSVQANTGGINNIPILGFLPFWPGYTKAIIEGDIVRLKKE